jgi:hypothetical protein
LWWSRFEGPMMDPAFHYTYKLQGVIDVGTI